ncbi:hypothetical protein FWC31_00555 [Candidatus Saccharibacteria bacterium]|nr:hypothetical protein [Candidatus Saccharibacteria bacterium]
MVIDACPVTTNLDTTNTDTPPQTQIPNKYHKNLIIIGDFHGAADEAEQLLRYALRIPDSMEFSLEVVEERCEALNTRIVFAGDITDRGPKPIKSGELVDIMRDSGYGLELGGNHDLYLWTNVYGFHLPWYDGYKGIPDREVILSSQKFDPLQAIANERAENPAARTPGYWAKYFADHKKYADKRQKEQWNSVCKDWEDTLNEHFNLQLDSFDKEKGEWVRNGDDALNFPQKYADEVDSVIVEDDQLRELLAWILGRKVETKVNTGLRAVERMSLNLWEDKLQELHEICDRYCDDSVLLNLKDRVTSLIEEYRNNLSEKMELGEWQFLAIDASMYGNYSRPENSTGDWMAHSVWGDSVIDERNLELSDDAKLDLSNYLDDPVIRATARARQKNFRIYDITDDGDIVMHGPLPLDKNGNISIGRVDEDGQLVCTDENGERFIGMDYKKIHCEGNQVFIGIQRVEEDIRNYDPDKDSPADIMEAWTLYNGMSADNTLLTKPDMVATNTEHIAATKGAPMPQESTRTERIARGLSIALAAPALGLKGRKIITGHNTLAKLLKQGIKRNTFAENGNVLWTNIDGGMSEYYGATGEIHIITDEGLKVYGFSGKGTEIELKEEIPADQYFSQENIAYAAMTTHYREYTNNEVA